MMLTCSILAHSNELTQSIHTYIMQETYKILPQKGLVVIMNASNNIHFASEQEKFLLR